MKTRILRKKLKCFLFLFFSSFTVFSQIGINTTSPQAVLDIASSNITSPTSNDGILIPRIDNFPAINPGINQNGMLVYATGSGVPSKGFYTWDNALSTWTPFVRKIDDLSDGKSDTTGSSVFLGLNSGDADDMTDNRNVGVGYQTLQFNTSGDFNIAVGNRSLYRNTIGFRNIGIGDRTLYENTSGNANTAVGYRALQNNSTGINNTAIGHNSLNRNISGNRNTAVGFSSLFNNTADSNVAVGNNTLAQNTTGTQNVAVGNDALSVNTVGSRNTALGHNSLAGNLIGIENTALGYGVLEFSLGSNNTSVGYYSLHSNTSGNFNSSLGYNSLLNNTTGTLNTAIGYNAFASGATFTNSTAIGNGATITASNQIRLGDPAVTSIGGYSNWTNVSDGRFKTNITENVVGLDFILKLRPVTYQLNVSAISKFNKIPKESINLNSEQLKSNTLQSGFIAQEVEIAAKNVGYDFGGIEVPKNEEQHYGLRYAEFVVPLTKAIQEQQQIINAQENKIKDLELRLSKLEQLLLNK